MMYNTPNIYLIQTYQHVMYIEMYSFFHFSLENEKVELSGLFGVAFYFI